MLAAQENATGTASPFDKTASPELNTASSARISVVGASLRKLKFLGFRPLIGA